MSDRTLSRLVKQELGMTFGQWRAQLHVVVVLQKLSQKETVQRISEDLGYESVSAFITFFKKMFGKPPAQYMKGFQ
jgi:AraC-like DNA-binding protein